MNKFSEIMAEIVPEIMAYLCVVFIILTGLIGFALIIYEFLPHLGARS
jgi:hypothetical protein